MEKVKVSIIYYSSTGTNYKMANWAKEQAESMGAQIRLRKVKELAPMVAIESNTAWKAHYEEARDVEEARGSDLEWADALIFLVPTRFGGPASQMKQFLDIQGGLWAQGKLANKAVTVMSSAGNAHGGQEATILGMYTVMMHWGAVIVPPGYTDPSIFKAGGNPYGTSVTVGENGMVEDVKDALLHQAKRLVEVAKKLKG